MVGISVSHDGKRDYVATTVEELSSSVSNIEGVVDRTRSLQRQRVFVKEPLGGNEHRGEDVTTRHYEVQSGR